MEEKCAWFFNDDPKFYTRVHVMYDKEKNPLDYQKGFKSANVLDISKVPVIIFNVRKSKNATVDYILKWDFVPNSVGVILANEKGASVLKEVGGKDIQILPAEIRMHSGEVLSPYYVINIITERDMLNKEKSILKSEEWREPWDMYAKSVYNKDCLGEHAFAKAKDDVIFLASEAVKEAVEKAKLKGLVFQDSYGGVDFIE